MEVLQFSIVPDFVGEESGFLVGFLDITHWCNVEYCKEKTPLTS